MAGYRLDNVPGAEPFYRLMTMILDPKQAPAKESAALHHERWGLLMALFAIRGLMHEAALKADEDPDRLSFLHAVQVVQRRLTRHAAIPPTAEESLA